MQQTCAMYLQLPTESPSEYPGFWILWEKALSFLFFSFILRTQPVHKCIQQLQYFFYIPHIWIQVIHQCSVRCLSQSYKHLLNRSTDLMKLLSLLIPLRNLQNVITTLGVPLTTKINCKTNKITKHQGKKSMQQLRLAYI